METPPCPCPIRPDLARCTPSGEAGNEAGGGLVRLWWPSLRVARSGKLLIRFHSLPFRPIAYRLRGAGIRRSRAGGNDGLRRMEMYTTMVEGGVSKGQ